MIKYKKLRELLCAGLNELIRGDCIDINDSNTKGSDGAIYTTVCGKKSKVSWRYYNHGEIRITIWWGVKSTCKDSIATLPLNKNKKDAFDACCSGWLEREEGIWLQGYGRQGLVDTYCARSAEEELFAIREIIPLGYNKEGLYAT
ncbi:MAG: hypothetical protein RBR40_12930 [Tenuifilaceae bacterium]|jgi:hypothetical protein|nr:hypothetical protein [Tenuifilaceae bacterium]